MTPAAAYNNPNRPGTLPPREIAPNRPSFLIQFLIHNPGLETDLTCTKQTPDPVSNRQFFALLKFPDTLLPGLQQGEVLRCAQDDTGGRQSGVEPPHSKKAKANSRSLARSKYDRFGMTD